MYNESNQRHQVCLAGRNSNSCNSQTHDALSGLYDLTAEAKLQPVKPRRNVRLKRANKSKLSSPGLTVNNNQSNKVDGLVFVPILNTKNKNRTRKISPRKSNGSQHVSESQIGLKSVPCDEKLKSKPDPAKRRGCAETASSCSKSARTSLQKTVDIECLNGSPLQSEKPPDATNTCNSNSFGIYITTNDAKQNILRSVSPQNGPNICSQNAYVQIKSTNDGHSNVYSNEAPYRNLPTPVTIEEKSFQQKTRYVTELKLNLCKGRAQPVSTNWSPDNSDEDSVSEDNEKQTESHDIQVKAILCRAVASNELQGLTFNDCGKPTAQNNTSKLTKEKSTSDSSVYSNTQPSSINVQATISNYRNCDKTNGIYAPIQSGSTYSTSQMTAKNIAPCVDMAPSEKQSKMTPRKRRIFRKMNGSKDQCTVNETTPNKDQNRTTPRQRKMHDKFSPGTVSHISTSRKETPLVSTEAYSMTPSCKLHNEWPTCNSKNGDLSQFIKEMALNNFQSVLNRARHDSSSDVISETSESTFVPSSAAEEHPVRSVVECISSATVISPSAGKTSRGTQSEQFKQVKVVRDMQIQTAFVDTSGISTNYNSPSGKLAISGGYSPIVRDAGSNNFVSRLPVPTITRLQPEWLTGHTARPRDRAQSVQRPSSEKMSDLETKRLVSPSPTSFLVFTQVNSTLTNINQTGSAQHTSVPSSNNSPIQTTFFDRSPSSDVYWNENTDMTKTNRSLYQVIRTNIPISTNKTSPKTVQPGFINLPKSPNIYATDKPLVFQDQNQFQENLTDDCRGDTGDKRGLGRIFVNSSTAFKVNANNTSHGDQSKVYPYIHNNTTPTTATRESFPVANEDVFVEGSTTPNSFQNSIIPRENTNIRPKAFNNQTLPQFEAGITNTTNANKPYLNTAGDYTSDTCGCCKGTTCDCPTTSTNTGSQMCSCEFCHGSATTSCEPTRKFPQPNNTQYLRRTAGDEGSLRAPNYCIGKQDQLRNVTPKPSIDANGRIMQLKPVPDGKTHQCSCCSDSALTEATITPKQQDEPRATHLPYTSEPNRYSNINPKLQTHVPEGMNGNQVKTIPRNVYTHTHNPTTQGNGFPNDVGKDPFGSHQAPYSPMQTVQGSSFLKKTSNGPELAETNTKRYVAVGNALSQARQPAYENLANPKSQPIPTKGLEEQQTYQHLESNGSRIKDNTPHVNSTKLTSTNPNIDTLLNLVSVKEKRNILQRWLLEQVAYSTKRNEEFVKVESPEDIKRRRDRRREEMTSSTMDDVSETDSVCSCSACQEDIGSRDTRKNRVNSDSSSEQYSISYTESYLSNQRRLSKPTAVVDSSQDTLKRKQIEPIQLRPQQKLDRHNNLENKNLRGRPLCSNANDSGLLNHKLSTRMLSTRSNSEGSLAIREGRREVSQERLLARKRTSHSVGWRTMDESVIPKATTNATKVSFNRQNDQNLYNSHQSRFNSPVRNVHQKNPFKRNEQPVISRSGIKTISNVAGQEENNKIKPNNKTTTMCQESREDKRQMTRIPAESPKPTEVPQRIATNLKNKTLNSSPVAIPNTKSERQSSNQRNPGIRKESNTGYTNGNAEFKVERVFELSPYDDLVKSHLSVADRRIKAVALKNGCDIRIVGPINTSDPSATGTISRIKVSYLCHVAGPNEDRVGKCLNFLKETFPNSFLRYNWRP